MKFLHLNILVLLVASEITPILGARLRCPSVDLENGNANKRSKGRIIVYKCNRGYTMLGEPYGACVRGKWDPDPPVCIKPGCSRIRNFKNGQISETMRGALLEFSCKPGYKLVGPSFMYCNGRRWNTMQPYCKAADISCNFESDTTCSWSVETHEDDDFMWLIQQQEPLSRILGTGPKSDHTFTSNDTGHYLMIETSDYGSASVIPARVHSPKFPIPSDNNTCFIFWYHMFGATVGMLNVFLNNKVVFQEKGNHGDRWIKGIVPLPNNGTDLQIIIEGTHGGGHTGDIALDDFSIGKNSECAYSKVISCEGRCYKNASDSATCLCNPECFVDSSCCEDYDQFCALDSTTSITVEQDSYETEFGDSPGTEESDKLSTELIPTYSTNIHLSSDISSSEFVTDISLLHSTEIVNEPFDVSSTSFSSGDEKETSKQFSKAFSTKSSTFEAKKFTTGSETQVFINERSTTSVGTESTEKPIITFEKKGTHLTNTTLIFIPTNKPSVSLATFKPLEVSTKYEINKEGKNVTRPSQTVLITELSTIMKPTPTGLFMTTGTKKTHLPPAIKNHSSSTKASIFTKINITPSIAQMKTVVRTIPQLETTTVNSYFPKITHLKQYNESFPTTLKPDKRTTKLFSSPTRNYFRPTSKIPFFSFKTKKKPVIDITLSKSKPQTIGVLYTTTPLQIASTKFTKKIIKQKTSKVKNPKIVSTVKPKTILAQNDSETQTLKSVTHLETRKTTTTQKNFRTSVNLNLTSLADKNYTINPTKFTSIEKPIEHVASKLDEKWHAPDTSHGTSKEKYQRNVEESTYSSSIGKEIIIIGVGSVILLIGGIYLAILIVKRQRLRFVNDSEGDVLYASSEEMLDLHLARPNQL